MQGALLRLAFFEEKGECIARVGDGDPIHTGRGGVYVSKLRDRMGAALRAARDALGDGGECSPAEAHQCLAEINDAGRLVLQRLFGAQLVNFRQQVQASIGSQPFKMGSNRDYPLMDVQMPDNFLQVEMLPLAQNGALEMESDADLADAAMRFPGFCFMTRRLPPVESMPQDRVLKGTPRVPVKMFYHVEFAGARGEARFLARNFALDGNGAWPDDPAHDDRAAIRAMVDCERSFAGATKPVLDQIHHFSCHSEQTEGDFPEPWLELCAEGGEPFAVYSDDFDRGLEQAATTYQRPFAFLNACVTNSPRSNTVDTWAASLLRNGYRGVIGTEAAAPDAFAATFARTFYGELLSRRTVGQSLQRAKWKLLRRWKNPMGLFYTLFGNPDLQIR